MKHCNSLVPYFVFFSLLMRFFILIPLGHISHPVQLVSFNLIHFHLFAGLCILAYFLGEGNTVAKGGRGQHALLQVVIHNPHYFRIMSPSFHKAS
ncbi:MAG: hypothetical protein EZS28_015710 [Streblomastix strix]|uniref:Uncharacterized protein n=1 Tax=Streblomastix strix TaxID=222440 RepID=A0A5J4W276_9EUKA|nr:MAG: hypothetical protein EZS28_015710 [Streblomastix strix]